MTIRGCINLIIIACLLIMQACNDTVKTEERLHKVEVYMDDFPERALEMLESMDMEDFSNTANQAKYALLYSMALDKNYIDVATDSIIAPAVRYYRTHGTPDEKLLAYYYYGITFLNVGDTEHAMKNYVLAERYANDCRDKGIVARLYKAKMVLYQELYDHQAAIQQGELAAKYFLEADDTLKYLNTINDLAVQSDIINDTSSVTHYLKEIEKHWDILNNVQKSNYFGLKLSDALNQSETNDIIDILDDYQQNTDPRYVRWLIVANAYVHINDYDQASLAIEKYSLYGGQETLPYYWISTLILENEGKYSDALYACKQYVKYLNENKIPVIDSDAKFVEERHLSEIKSLKQRLYIVIVTFSLILIILVLIILSQRVRNVNKERQLLKAEKDEVENMFESLKSEVEQLKKIKQSKSLDKDILTTIEQRLNVLNMFILAELSDSFEKIAYNELRKLMENRDDFLESTKKTFIISHPKFIEYLQIHNLTEWEIGCCCLYCIGFNGAEISEYLNRKAIYNVASTIRHKLNVPKGGTQIDVFLKQKMKDFHS